MPAVPPRCPHTRASSRPISRIWPRLAVKPQPSAAGEEPARQPGPGNGVIAFFDPLLRGAALVVKRLNPLGWPRHVGHDEPDARMQFVKVPLHLGHNPAWLGSRSGLVTEARTRTAGDSRWSRNCRL
jgi:hypothetical protein